MDIPKPPATLIGPYQHRTADGSGNNVFSPDVGKANMPYARTVPPIHPVPRNLPDVDLVWETLLKQDKFTPHPSGISPLLFSFAVLITHSIFQTNHDEPAYNETSSYLDLAPIYGNNETEQKQVRLGENGLLHPDTIASRRLFLMTPAAVALAIVFARNHNWIAKKLVEVNENDVYQPWDQLDQDGKAKQDEDIFQKARMINCGHFVAVIFQDYIRAILAINRTTSTWSLVPTGEIKEAFQGPLPRGTGNHVSAELCVAVVPLLSALSLTDLLRLLTSFSIRLAATFCTAGTWRRVRRTPLGSGGSCTSTRRSSPRMRVADLRLLAYTLERAC